jgi:threonine dehydratase
VNETADCTAGSPGGLTMERVAAARKLLQGVGPASRMVLGRSFAPGGAGEVHLKLESEGPTGSFKWRGAYCAVWKRMQGGGKIRGAVTSSTGNHGAATAWAARKMGIPARVYLPKKPNASKRLRIAQEGAEIIEAGSCLEESREHAERFARESGWYNLVDGVEPEMLPGTAAIGAEAMEQVSLAEGDAIFVPVGDSTLIRGLAYVVKQMRPGVRVIGVQAERAPTYALGFRAGKGIRTETSETIADGLAVRVATEENVREMAGLVDEFVLVSEEEMLGAVRQLVLEEQVVAEPAGAAATAAYGKTAEKYKGKKVVLLVTGANIAEELLTKALG